VRGARAFVFFDLKTYFSVWSLLTRRIKSAFIFRYCIFL